MNDMTEIFNSPEVSRALARKRKLEEEIRQIDLFVALFKKFARDESEAFETPVSSVPHAFVRREMSLSDANELGTDTAEFESESAASAEKLAAGEPNAISDKRRLRMPQEDFERIVRGILLDIGRPLLQEDILQALHAKGRGVGGADELSTIKTKMWRAKGSIVRIPGAGFWPRDVPCPAVGYQPDVP